MNIQINWDYANAHNFSFYHPGKSHVEFELSNVMGLSLVQAKAMQRSKSCRDKGLIPVLCRDSGVLLGQQEQAGWVQGVQSPLRADQPPLLWGND